MAEHNQLQKGGCTSKEKKMRDEVDIDFLSWKLAEEESNQAEKKAALARANADTARLIFFKKMSEITDLLYS